MRFSVCTRVPVRHVLVYCVALVFAYAVLLPCVDIEHYSPKGAIDYVYTLGPCCASECD